MAAGRSAVVSPAATSAPTTHTPTLPDGCGAVCHSPETYPRSVSPLVGRKPSWVVVVAAGLVTVACSGGEPPSSTGATSTPARTSAAAVAPLPPADFASVLAADDVLVVNVHVPDEGSIPGTDVAVPFDEIRDRSAELPQDRDTPLAVYCKSGRMSAEAVSTLQQLGYTDVVELRGGMDAWIAAGRELLLPAG